MQGRERERYNKIMKFTNSRGKRITLGQVAFRAITYGVSAFIALALLAVITGGMLAL